MTAPSSFEPLFAAAFTLLGSPVTWLEIVAFGLSVWMVVCNMRVDPLLAAGDAAFARYACFSCQQAYGEGCLRFFFVLIAPGVVA